MVSSDGDWLNLDKTGVSLFVPDGVVDKGEELFSVEVSDEEWNRPMLQDGEFLFIFSVTSRWSSNRAIRQYSHISLVYLKNNFIIEFNSSILVIEHSVCPNG